MATASPPSFTPVPLFEGSSTPSPTGFTNPNIVLGTKLTAGTKVGEYQIQERIGEGGMGTVYSAVHPIIGKKVAIKILAGRLAKNKNAIRRFVLEARAVNDIRHPGLVDIFSFGQLTDGRHYYVMEFLEGKNLGDILRDRMRVPMAEAIPIFLEVGNALVAVHSKSIVHRDLKPENILILASPLSSGQKVKLVDFGLAKLVEVQGPSPLADGIPRTAAGVNVGTPHYMSPEQCRGQKVDARSDLYSLGVLFYETVTGRLPFDGATPVDIWQAHVEKAPKPPNEICPGIVTPAVNSIILRLLAKHPDHRFQTAADFCTALSSAVADAQPRPSTTAVEPEKGPAQTDRSLSSGQIRPSPALTDESGAARSRPLEPRARTKAHDEMVSTTEDLPAVVLLPDVAINEEERRKEIEELRASLGLRIEEPARSTDEEEQMSAMVIDLGPGRAPVDGKGSGPAKPDRHQPPPPVAAAAQRRPSVRIDPRNQAPSRASLPARATKAVRSTVEVHMYEPSRGGKIARAALVIVLLAAAVVVAVSLIG